MKNFAISLVLLLVAMGCTGKVQVVDTAGKPVAGASVYPVGPSVSGSAVVTDANGEALVSLSAGIQATEWVSVTKDGFDPQQVDVPPKWPLKVVLQRTKTH